LICKLKYGGDLFDTKTFDPGVFKLAKEKREEVARMAVDQGTGRKLLW
jgi:hypothetical protein